MSDQDILTELLFRARRGGRRAMNVLRGRSSITDDGAYTAFAARAASDDDAFDTFRREPVYVETLEHVTERQGAEYIDVIRRDTPSLLDEWLDVARRNDDAGSPLLYDYAGIGDISPVTLRYLKVVSDLETRFGDLSGVDVVEIGVGYGGQARLILERWPVRSYTLIDLPPVLALADRFLRTLKTDGAWQLTPPGDLQSLEPGLVISNYSFSELSRKHQERYAELVLSRSDRGYLTCNFISDLHGVESWSKQEIEAVHDDAAWSPEEPLTYPGNAILTWGSRATTAHGSQGA